MVTTIDKNGTLIIKAESGLEAYALTQWCEDNTINPNDADISFDYTMAPAGALLIDGLGTNE